MRERNMKSSVNRQKRSSSLKILSKQVKRQVSLRERERLLTQRLL
jgi:hypothetical protein